MKNKFLKSMTLVLAVAMVMSLVPAVVSAAPAITEIEAVLGKDSNGNKTVTVTANVADLTEYTLLAVRDNAAYEGTADLAALAEADLEKQVEYIDQPAVSGTSITYTFPLRDRDGDLAMTVADCYVNVFLGGAGASAVYTAVKDLADGPDLEVEDATKAKYYTEDENIVIQYSFGTDTAAEAAWEAKTLDIKIDGTVITDVVPNTSGNYFTIPAKSLEKKKYEGAKLTIAESDADNAAFNASEVALPTFEVASRIDEAKAAVKAPEAVPNNDDTAVTITTPATSTVAGVSIAYELVSTTGFTDNGDGTITVTRPAKDAAPIVITYKATLTYTGLDPVVIDDLNVTVKAAGAVIEAENVTILKASGAYGAADKALVKVVVTDDSFNNNESKLTIGGAELYYCVDEDAYYGVIASTYTDTEAIASDAEEVTGETKTFYKGNAELSASRPKPGQPLMTDAYKAARTAVLFINQPATAAATDAFELIACDFDFNGQVLMTDAYAIAGAAVAAIQG